MAKYSGSNIEHIKVPLRQLTAVARILVKGNRSDRLNDLLREYSAEQETQVRAALAADLTENNRTPKP